MASGLGAMVLAGGLLCLSGCANLGYYWQSASGHMRMLQSARPVQDWLDDAEAPARLKEKLALSQQIRAFASSELGLPDNPSYRRYADLRRAAVVYNVVAAPEYSLKLKTWCFPVTGCVSYRGYFDEAEARAQAARVKAEGFEVDVYPVPAYSTLGWMNWAGGDPLLNTFIHYPEGELARLIFHELAHHVAYAADDTTFNESFAVAVERIGGQRWLDRHGGPAARADSELLESRRSDFRAFTQRWRAALEQLYSSPLGEGDKLQRKAELMAAMRADYAQVKAERWAGYAGYDGWLARANNASFGVLAAYNELVPQFEDLFRRGGGDFARFYAEVRALAALPKDQRRAKLAAPH